MSHMLIEHNNLQGSDRKKTEENYGRKAKKEKEVLFIFHYLRTLIGKNRRTPENSTNYLTLIL